MCLSLVSEELPSLQLDWSPEKDFLIVVFYPWWLSKPKNFLIGNEEALLDQGWFNSLLVSRDSSGFSCKLYLPPTGTQVHGLVIRAACANSGWHGKLSAPVISLPTSSSFPRTHPKCLVTTTKKVRTVSSLDVIKILLSLNLRANLKQIYFVFLFLEPSGFSCGDGTCPISFRARQFNDISTGRDTMDAKWLLQRPFSCEAVTGPPPWLFMRGVAVRPSTKTQSSTKLLRRIHKVGVVSTPSTFIERH